MRDEIEYYNSQVDANATPAFVVYWDNGHSCGQLPGMYDTQEEAEQVGEDWRLEMIAIDDNRTEAEAAYGFDILQGWCVDGEFVRDADD